MLNRLVPSAILAFGLLAVPALGQKPTTKSKAPTLGDKVVDYCKGQKGKKVGAGECADLAQAALDAAGAKGRGPDDPNDGDYTWGDLVLVWESTKKGPRATKGKLADLQPGDILQFRDAKFEGPLRDGKRGTYSMTASHHTAIIAKTENQGQVWRILQQNSNGQRIVTEGTMYPTDLSKGWIRAYHPVSEPKE